MDPIIDNQSLDYIYGLVKNWFVSDNSLRSLRKILEVLNNGKDEISFADKTFKINQKALTE